MTNNTSGEQAEAKPLARFAGAAAVIGCLVLLGVNFHAQRLIAIAEAAVARCESADEATREDIEARVDECSMFLDGVGRMVGWAGHACPAACDAPGL